MSKVIEILSVPIGAYIPFRIEDNFHSRWAKWTDESTMAPLEEAIKNKEARAHLI